MSADVWRKLDNTQYTGRHAPPKLPPAPYKYDKIYIGLSLYIYEKTAVMHKGNSLPVHLK